MQVAIAPQVASARVASGCGAAGACVVARVVWCRARRAYGRHARSSGMQVPWAHAVKWLRQCGHRDDAGADQLDALIATVTGIDNSLHAGFILGRSADAASTHTKGR